MTPAPRKTMLETMTGVATLPAELRRAPRHRQEKKVKDSAVGWVFVILGVLVLGFVGYLAYLTHSAPNLWLLGGGVVVACGLMVFGGVVADRETFLPVASAFLSMVLRAKKAMGACDVALAASLLATDSRTARSVPWAVRR